MIWIVIYLLVGVAMVALLIARNLPYDVQLGDAIAVPFLILLWPAVALFLVLEDGLLERHLFTIGDRDDNQD